jgi:hypothetical protein
MKNFNYLHKERGSRKFIAGMSWRTCENEAELDGWLDAAATFLNYEMGEGALQIIELLTDMVALFPKGVIYDN